MRDLGEFLETNIPGLWYCELSIFVQMHIVDVGSKLQAIMSNSHFRRVLTLAFPNMGVKGMPRPAPPNLTEMPGATP